MMPLHDLLNDYAKLLLSSSIFYSFPVHYFALFLLSQDAEPRHPDLQIVVSNFIQDAGLALQPVKGVQPYSICLYRMPRQVSSPMIVVSNRLPFVLTRNSSGQLERKSRLVLKNNTRWLC
jgi:hypothetical protein